jgi:hypothetical protein
MNNLEEKKRDQTYLLQFNHSHHIKHRKTTTTHSFIRSQKKKKQYEIMHYILHLSHVRRFNELESNVIRTGLG